MGKLKPDDFLNESIRDLGYAICIQAAVDYRQSLLCKFRKKDYPNGIDPPEVYERFFDSEWFRELSGLSESGEKIAEYIRRNKDKKLNVFNVLG